MGKKRDVKAVIAKGLEKEEGWWSQLRQKQKSVGLFQ
jgi:hypothetical protein